MAIAGILTNLLLAAQVAAPTPPLSPALPFFESEPQALLAAATSASAGRTADVVVLDEDGLFTFDEQGRCTWRFRLTYKVLTQTGADDWKSLRADWAPWHQERPVLRARVVRADGTVHLLDPRTVAEAPVDSSSEVLSDARRLLAPLPGIAIGAVVERETVVRDTAPVFDGGDVHSFFFARRKETPALWTRAEIDAPESLPLHFVQRRLELTPRRTTADGRVRVVFESGLLEPSEVPDDAPPELPRWPRISFSTGRSWQDVAQRYEAVVERQIADADLKSLVGSSVAGAKTAAEKAQRLLELLQREIRYTGVELGEAAIVPRPPAETLNRRYGDCKDQSALLVALLRVAGVPAHLALLRAGSTPEVEEELPGFGQFNHAIVVCPGRTPLWIDPTVRFAHVGQLPDGAQGRRALIVARDTRGLVTTPEARAEENRTVETREFFLAPEGPARIVETTEVFGKAESSLRRSYERSDAAKLRERLEGYVRSEYSAKEVSRCEWSEPADRTQPMRLVLETPQGARGTTGGANAAVALLPGTFVRDLPELFRPAANEKADEKAGDAAKRDIDYVFPNPYLNEWRYRIVPPPGFVVGPLPASDVLTWGPVELRRDFKQEADRVVTAHLRVTVGKRRLTPAEFEALRDGARAFAKTPALMITFDQAGEAHLAAGRIREALDEFRRLTREYPREVRYQTQLARALLGAGLGGAAREAARRAVEGEPSSAMAQATLGWVLEHDLIGRHRARGFDYEGAVAAYRKALELDGSVALTRASLAILLEYDSLGRRYAPGARLAESAALYREIREAKAELDLDNNLLSVLAWQRDFAGLRREAEALPSRPTRDAMIVLAVAATDGPAPAVARAAELCRETDKRRDALVSAGSTLFLLGRYAESAALLTEAARGASNSAELTGRADLVRQVKRFDGRGLPPGEPITVARRALEAAARLADEQVVEDAAGLLTPGLLADLAKPGHVKRSRINEPVFALSGRGVSIEVALDVAQSLLRFTSEGNPRAGYRVRARGAAGDDVIDFSLYLTPTPDGLRLCTVDGFWEDLGREAWSRIEAGDEASASQWLDWAREAVRSADPEDPLGGPPFARLWTLGMQADTRRLRVAAASLIFSAPEVPGTLEVLERAAAESGEAAERTALEAALVGRHSELERHEAARSLADRLAERFPRAPGPLQAALAASIRLKDWDGARRRAEERLRLLPNDAPALRGLAATEMACGATRAAAQVYQRIIDSTDSGEEELNNLAWLALVHEEVDDGAVALARQALAHARGGSYSALHTLAALYAELGRLTEAREMLVRAVEAGERAEPDDNDWYVVARLAEQYGEPEAARELYGRVTEPEDKGSDPSSCYRLAQRRLARLAAQGTRAGRD